MTGFGQKRTFVRASYSSTEAKRNTLLPDVQNGELAGLFARLVKRSAKLCQYPESQQIDTNQRLYSGDGSDPACGPQGILPRLNSGNPVADINVPPAYMKSGKQAEIKRIANTFDKPRSN